MTVNPRSGVVRVSGKRNKYRDVPLHRTAREALRVYLTTLPKDTRCLFPSRKGVASEKGGAHPAAPTTPRALGYLVARYAHLAKVADVSPHDLRHRFGYRIAEAVPVHRLGQLMGHDSSETTRISVASTRADVPGRSRPSPGNAVDAPSGEGSRWGAARPARMPPRRLVVMGAGPIQPIVIPGR